MQIRLLFFGAITEALMRTQGSETVELPAHCTHVSHLLSLLRSRGEAWERELGDDRAFRVAVQQRLVNGDAELSPGCEVAIFSLITGG
ncbi:MAG: MoaD/ThiS family protein [Burkholderiaceae bacterium]|nr:MoaD/ThiS family protein [Burkholderiaceae bacterium]